MLFTRPTTPDDEPALRVLLNDVWPEGGGAYHGSGRRPGLIAEHDGRLVGYAHAWCSPLHPRHTYVGVHVHPGQRRLGLGPRLWNEVTRDVTGSVKVKTYESQEEGVRFLERQGLTLTVETHEPTLGLADLDAAQLNDWQAEARASGFELLPMTALPAGSGDALTLLHDRVYAHTHAHDPATPGLLGEEDFLGDDLVPEWLWVARKGGVLAGVASIRTDEPLPALGGFGVTPEFAAHGRALTLALVARAIHSARQDGLTHLTAELDSADPNALHLWHTLPWRPGATWLTFTGKPK